MRGAVRMVNQSTFPDRPSIMQGLLQSIENKVCPGGPGDPPPDDAISESVDDEGHTDKALPRGYIGKIADLLPGRRYAVSTGGHSRFCAGARKMRFTLSRGQGADVSRTVVLTTFPRTAPRMPICFIHCPAGYFRRKCPERETVHRAARQRKALPLKLMPRLADPVDLIVFVPDPFNLGAKLCVTLMPRRGF